MHSTIHRCVYFLVGLAVALLVAISAAPTPSPAIAKSALQTPTVSAQAASPALSTWRNPSHQEPNFYAD